MKGKRRLAVLLVCMLLGLTACGGENGQNGAEGDNVILQQRINEDLIYYKSDLDLGLTSGASYVDFKVYGLNIYYPDGKNIVTYSSMDSEKRVDIYQWADAPGEWSFQRVCYSGTGEVYGVVNVQNIYYLCKFDTERKLEVALDLREYYKDAGESFSDDSRLEVGDDGRVYLSNTGVLWIFEADGSYKGQVSFKDAEDVWVRDMQSSAEGKLYVLYDDNATEEQYVAEIDTEKSAVTARQKTIGLTGISVLEEKLLGYSGAGVYTYDREAWTLTELFKWTECNLKSVTIYSAKQLSDGSIFAAGQFSGGGVASFLVKSLLIGTPETSESGKTDIRLAMMFKPSTELTLAVARFNKSNEQYNIVVESYGLESKEEGIARLKGEIAAGNGPDMVDMNFGLEKSLVEEGYLEDLSLWLAESDAISEGDFLNFALEEYRVDGILAAIPHRFSMMIMIGNSDLLGEKPGWTMEDMLDFLEQNVGNQVFADDENVRTILWSIMRLNEDYFVDRDASTCNFDNDIFRRIVEVGAYYPLDYERVEGAPSRYTNLQNGNGVLCPISISDFIDLQAYEAALGGAMNCIGLPTEEGIGVMANTYDALGISTLSEYKDGAWEFLEYFLRLKQDDLNRNYYLTYIPSLEKVADWYLNNKGAMKMQASDDFTYEYHITTQEEMDLYFELLENARTGSTDVGLINLILEEMGDYYNGDKTMDELIASLETRVKLYLEETQ